MPVYKISEIEKIVNGTCVVSGNKSAEIQHLAIDSRRIGDAGLSLFFAVESARNDGHRYINDVYQQGVRNFIIRHLPENIGEYKDSNFIKVENTLQAMQKLAAYHRKRFSIPVIGITGSNGKTIVKEWLYQLMSPDKNIVRSPKSYNSQIGVPLSVWQMEPEHEMAVFEAGISEPDEMENLHQIIMPETGIFTNIGTAHDKGFINISQKAGEKLKLFTKVNTLIYCSDYCDIQHKIISSEILKNKNLFTWSRRHDADLKIISIEKNQNHTLISAMYASAKISIQIPFTDDASVENAIHCWSLMLLSGYKNSLIAERIKNLAPVAMRLEMKAGINNCSIINDSYSSDLNSINIALDFLGQQHQHKKNTVIMSDILQSTLSDRELYAAVGKLLTTKGITRFIGIGKSIARHAEMFEMEKEFFESTEQFLLKFKPASFFNETILIKGARIFEFEQLSRLLQQKSHETVLEINLNALIHNLNYYRSLLPKNTAIMAMVKAFSYGSGSFEIANMLQYHNIDYLAVAYADEGIELRKAQISTPIMVMNPEPDSFELMIKYNLEPEIYSFRTLSILLKAIKNTAYDEIHPLPVHVKIDTGMHRLGFDPEECGKLAAILKTEGNIVVKSVFSHLSASEDPNEDTFTLKQIDLLKQTADHLSLELKYPVMIHVLNSAGIRRFPEASFNMVRLGIGLYGISYDSEEQAQLLNVSTLKTTVSQIKEIKKGDTVGYGRSWIAKKDTRIAVLPVGYADGLNRKLSKVNGCFYFQGQILPLIGNICMDMCMLDVSGFEIEEGDTVSLFHDAEGIKTLAQKLETIPYEILTSVSGRVKRVYYYE